MFPPKYRCLHNVILAFLENLSDKKVKSGEKVGFNFEELESLEKNSVSSLDICSNQKFYSF